MLDYPEYTLGIQARYGEAGTDGKIRLGALANWFQEAAGHNASALGFGDERLFAEGKAWILTRMTFRIKELFYDANYVATDMKGQPDFVKLADAYGAEGYRITTEEELEELLPKALASPRTAVIDVLVDREENVSPIVPAGASLDEMLIV